MQTYATRGKVALSASLITRTAQKSGYDYKRDEVFAECQFLTDSEYLIAVPDLTGETRFRISPKAVVHYEAGNQF